jgi:hypothetical protein
MKEQHTTDILAKENRPIFFEFRIIKRYSGQDLGINEIHDQPTNYSKEQSFLGSC